MTDRLADIIVGLQRMAENAVIKGDDLRYLQHQQTLDHVGWLDQQIEVLDTIRASYMEQRRKFVPERVRPALPQDTVEKMPRVVAQGPKAAQG